MSFDLLTFLTKALGGLSTPTVEGNIQAWLEEHAAEYPDLKDRAAALSAFISTTLAEVQPGLDPATMKNTILGVASDIVHGTSGVDPGAWQGGG